MTDRRQACCDLLLAFIEANPGVRAARVYEEIVSALYPRRMVEDVLRGLRETGEVVVANQYYRIGSTRPQDVFDAEAHLRGYGALGEQIRALAITHEVPLRVLLTSRGPKIGRIRGMIVPRLHARSSEIAGALRMALRTVQFYRGSVAP